MTKLKRMLDGKVFDCTILYNQNPENANDLRVIFYEDSTWKDYPLSHFAPAQPEIDY